MSGRSARARRKAATGERPRPPNAHPGQIDAFDHLAQVLGGFSDSVDRLRELPRSPGSPAQADDAQSAQLGTFDELTSPGLEASLLPVRQLGYAVDHLRGAAVTLQTPGIILSSFTLFRSVAESSAHAFYVAEPGISSRSRVARWLNLYLLGLEETVYFADEDDKAEVAARYQACVAQAREAGFSVEKARGAQERYLKVFVVDEEYPRMKHLLDALHQEADPGVGSNFYQYLSGIAHGQEHAITTFRSHGSAQETEDPRVGRVGHQLSPPMAMTGASFVVDGLRIATQRTIDYNGWSAERWPADVARTYAALGHLNRLAGNR